jgi:hypothetical protein
MNMDSGSSSICCDSFLLVVNIETYLIVEVGLNKGTRLARARRDTAEYSVGTYRISKTRI